MNKTPFNNFINGKSKNKPDFNLVQTPLHYNMQLTPININFKTNNVPTQMYTQQRTECKKEVFDEENNSMKSTPYQKLR